MKNSIIIVLCCAALCISNGCSSDDEPSGGINTGDFIIQAMIGDWRSTSAVFTNINDQTQTRDVVADGGLCDLSVSQNRSFALVVRNPGVPDPQITTGVFVANGEFIDAIFDSDPNVVVPWDFSLSGDNLTIQGAIEYDFESDGTFENTAASMQFLRN